VQACHSQHHAAFFVPLARGSDHYQIWILNAIGEVVSVFEITAKFLLLRKDGLT
jgi:hypothetical protein